VPGVRSSNTLAISLYRISTYLGERVGHSQRIAVVGAGISGLVLAQHLRRQGFQVTVFEKSRGPGGRGSTRRRDEGTYDHGLPFFQATTPEFRAVVETWREQGWVDVWSPKIHPSSTSRTTNDSASTYWVGVPRMSALSRGLAGDLDAYWGHRVNRLDRVDETWLLSCEGGTSESWRFDTVVLTCPGPQAHALAPTGSCVQRRAESLRYTACWAVMLAFGSECQSGFDLCTLKHGPVQLLAKESSKPDRVAGERWVVHASADWSLANIEAAPEWVCEQLFDAVSHLFGGEPVGAVAHRWRYARGMASDGPSCVWDADTNLGLCGDALTTGDVEGAWRSGAGLAAALLGQ